MNILTSLVFAMALFLSAICIFDTADSCAHGTQRNITGVTILASLVWGLFYYLTH